MENRKYQLVVDESVFKTAVDAFAEFAKKQRITYSDILYLKDAHRGIPDIKIINNLLNESTLFLTADRVAHNLVLKKKLKSFYFRDGKISDALLPDIVSREIKEVAHKDKLYEESFLANSVTRNCVLPAGEKQLKNLTTKRRRIRNHFGGFDQLGEIAVTVSWERFFKEAEDQQVFGYQIQAISKNGMPAIMASENYIVDISPYALWHHTAMCYALIVLLRLSLQTLPVKIYFDAKPSNAKAFSASENLDREHQKFFDLLKKEFVNVEFIGVDKGFHLLQTRKKLFQIKGNPRSNELVYDNIAEIGRKVLAQKPELAPLGPPR